MTTVFSRIIDEEIPATKIYEDEKVLAFLDIEPKSKGHTLLIPKAEYAWMQDVPDDLLAYCFTVAKRIMIAMKEALPCDFVVVKVVGTDVPHFHIHLIPGYHDETAKKERSSSYKGEEKEEIGQLLREKLKRS